MAAESFKDMTISEGVTYLNDGEMLMCNEPGCTKKAAYKLECGNYVAYSCKEHLASAKTRMNESPADEDARVCSQDGPNDLKRHVLDVPAY